MNEPKVSVTFRTGPAAAALIDDIAHDNRTSRTLVLRGCLAIALRHKTELTTWIKEHL